MAELDANDPTRIGPYELLGILGSGGMGRVYLGRDADGGRVAVKVVHTDLAREPEFRRRFRREIEALRAVSGPGIASILDADAEARRPWLATEYVDGPSLHEVVAVKGTLDAAALRALGADLARTLAAVHALNLVHRDIKPTNLLLSADGPKLIDFGIARDLAASSITRTGFAVGTPQFMAPEQLESDHRTGTAADVFALAGLLVFAASGHGPFGEGTPAQLLYGIVHSEPELDDVPTDLRPLLTRCLAKDPAKRPTAKGVAQELERTPAAEDSAATVPLADGLDGPGGSGGPTDSGGAADPGSPAGGGRRRRRAAVVGVATLAAVVVAAAVLAEGNGAWGDNSDHSAKSGAQRGGGTSASDSTGVSGTGMSSSGGGGPTGGSQTSQGTALSSGPSGSGSASGSAASGTGSAASGGPTRGISGGPGPTTTNQPAGSHSSSPVSSPAKPVTSTRTSPPSSHAPTTPPAGSAPGPVTGLSTHVDAPEYITMTINWSADPGAASYVLRYTESGRTGEPSDPESGTSADIPIIPGETVCIQLQGVNSYGVSAWSPASPDCVIALSN